MLKWITTPKFAAATNIATDITAVIATAITAVLPWVSRCFSYKLHSTFYKGYFAVIFGVLLLLGSCDWLSGFQDENLATEPNVAVINDQSITLREYQDQYQQLMLNWGYSITPSIEEKQQIKEWLLDSLIDITLLQQEAARQGITVDENTQELQTQLDGAIQNNRSNSVLGVNLWQETWQRKLQRNAILRKLTLQEVWGKIEVSEAETRAYYDLNRKKFVYGKQIKVRHLCVNSMHRLKQVQSKLRSGEDFIHLIRDFSITPDRKQDGDLGYVERGVLPPEFDAVIFKIKRVGKYSSFRRPLQTNMGVHLFRLEGRKPARSLSYAQAKPRIRNTLRDQKQAKAYQNWINSIKNKASIQIDRDLLYGI